MISVLYLIPYPVIDPILCQVGPVKLHWYGISYVLGIILAWRYALYLLKRHTSSITPQNLDDYIIWALAGIVIGGRLGHVLFYDFQYFLSHPEQIIMTWKGGMSFHGGLIGVICSTFLFTRKHNIPFLSFTDIISVVAPIGLFLGRLANFINGELFGRVSDVPWAMVFPQGGPEPRHPSQLYEAFLEGILLFFILSFLWKKERIRTFPGRITGVFLVGYGLSRSLVEFVREPESMGLLWMGTTIGQWLSFPLIIGGIYLLLRKHNSVLNNPPK